MPHVHACRPELAIKAAEGAGGHASRMVAHVHVSAGGSPLATPRAALDRVQSDAGAATLPAAPAARPPPPLRGYRSLAQFSKIQELYTSRWAGRAALMLSRSRALVGAAQELRPLRRRLAAQPATAAASYAPLPPTPPCSTAPCRPPRRQSCVFKATCLASGSPVILKRYSKEKMDVRAVHKMRREVRGSGVEGRGRGARPATAAGQLMRLPQAPSFQHVALSSFA